jgi:Tol biopolymer transport system component/DNA-binding winged helix-turn-helix (wHTH) protein
MPSPRDARRAAEAMVMADLVYSSPQRVRFGAFEVDLRAGELWKSGRKRKLTGQPFAVLAILLERPGEVVTREELQKRLWPDTFVDVDHNLNTAINKIREALGDSSEHPRFVETLSRRGYRFIAPVEFPEPAGPTSNGTSLQPIPVSEPASSNGNTTNPSAALSPAITEAPPGPVAAPKRRTWLRTVLWPTAAIAILLLAWLLRPSMPPPTVTGTEQLTRDGVQKGRFWGSPPSALQTDGSTVYFVETAGFNDRLMEVSTEGGDTAPIDVPLDFTGISNIAPDRPELLIAGSPNMPQGLRVWRVPVPAGQPRPIGNLVAGDVAFSLDATVLFFSRGSDIFRANSDGSDPRKILTANGRPYWLRVSPDGRLLRFSVQTQLNTNTLWEARLDGSHMRQLLANWDSTNVCCGNWTSDGKYFLFQAMHEGVGNLWAMREKSDLWRKTNHVPVQLTVGEANSQAPLPSKDGTKVFFLAVTRHGELIRYDLKTRKFTPYLSGLSAEGVAFSPDGKRVAYVTFPEGILWESGTDGSGKRQLSFPPMRVALPRWSPDGTRIAFLGHAPGQAFQLYVVPAEGSDPEQLTSGESDKLDASWSPDGNSLAFSGNPFVVKSSEAPAIHIMHLKTRQITDIPGSAKLYSPRWSPDGRYLVAMTVDFRKIVLYNFAQQKWEDLVTMTQPSYPAWSHDGKCIYFANPYMDPKEPVYRICLNDRKLEHIVDLSDAGRLAEGQFGRWTGLAPDDSILATRDISIEEIYALETKFP